MEFEIRDSFRQQSVCSRVAGYVLIIKSPVKK
jgi:hypothetical protein